MIRQVKSEIHLNKHTEDEIGMARSMHGTEVHTTSWEENLKESDN
jgi:hypothetical protein